MKKSRALALSVLSTFAVMGLIIYFSSQTSAESNGLSMGLASRLLALFRVADPEPVLELLNPVLRKLAHFTLYLLLGICMSGAAFRQRKLPPVVLVILAGLLFAASDEFHQCFSQGRTPSLLDVLIDTCGAAVGTVPATFKHRRSNKRKDE